MSPDPKNTRAAKYRQDVAFFKQPCYPNKKWPLLCPFAAVWRMTEQMEHLSGEFPYLFRDWALTGLSGKKKVDPDDRRSW